MKKDIGRVIANTRKAKGITQSELARAVGIDQSYLSKIESGEANPTTDILVKIAKQLNIHSIKLT